MRLSRELTFFTAETPSNMADLVTQPSCKIGDPLHQPQSTAEWQSLYPVRTSAEPYFRSADHPGLLNRDRCLGIDQIGLNADHDTIASLWRRANWRRGYPLTSGQIQPKSGERRRG